MFCAEMDGIESLQQMVIILASNRADMIDPAILRPGRIDRKIKVSRPTKRAPRKSTASISTRTCPLDPQLLKDSGDDRQKAVDAIIEKVIDAQFSQREDNRFLEVTLRSGRTNICTAAISSAARSSRASWSGPRKRRSNAPSPRPNRPASASRTSWKRSTWNISRTIFFPPNDITEDWLKLVDYDPENVGQAFARETAPG